MAKKKAFGGYSINFKGCKDTMESVMGSSPIGPSEMTKKIWGYVNRKTPPDKKCPRHARPDRPEPARRLQDAPVLLTDLVGPTTLPTWASSSMIALATALPRSWLAALCERPA